MRKRPVKGTGLREKGALSATDHTQGTAPFGKKALFLWEGGGLMLKFVWAAALERNGCGNLKGRTGFCKPMGWRSLIKQPFKKKTVN